MNLLNKLLATMLITGTIAAPVVGHFGAMKVSNEKSNIATSSYLNTTKKHLKSASELTEETKKRIFNYLQAIDDETIDAATHELTLFESTNEIPIRINSSIKILCDDMLEKNIITKEDSEIILNKTININYKDLSPEVKEMIQIIHENKIEAEFMHSIMRLSGFFLVFDVLGLLPFNWRKGDFELFDYPAIYYLYKAVWL